jgi:glycosyltransferase involved in cell wall biosynthesis
MVNVYCTADRIGALSGGGIVTKNELEALVSTGQTVAIGCPEGRTFQDPFAADEWVDSQVSALLASGRKVEKAHCYAGTFSRTVATLKAAGSKVTYTAAAHDPRLSREEYEKLGIPFNYPHLTDPDLWQRYLEGYRSADLVICPSKASAKIMEGFGCGNVCTIPHGVDLPDKIAPFPKRFTAAYLGQPGPDKGLLYLLRAWKSLGYRDAKLVIAGRGTENLVGLFRSHGGGMVELRGFAPSVGAIYDECSVYVQPSVCLMPGSIVIANAHPKDVETLGANDCVLSADGSYRKVIKPIRNEYRGTLCSLRTIGIAIPTRMTAMHRVLCIRRGLGTRRRAYARKVLLWKEALRLHKTLGVGSRLIARRLGLKERQVSAWIYEGCRPEGRESNFSVKEDAQRLKPEWTHAINVECGDLVLFPRIKEETRVTHLFPPQRKTGSSGNRTRELPQSIEVNDDVLRLLGLYISEGCATGDAVAFCFHRDERAYVRDVTRCVRRTFGLDAAERPHRVKSSTTVWVYSTLLSQWLSELCGKEAHHKRLPDWALKLPEDQLTALLRGVWDGDGSVFVKRNGLLGATYSTVSRTLAYQLVALLVKLGFMPKLHDEGSRGFSVRMASEQTERFALDILRRNPPKHRQPLRPTHRTWIDENYYYMPVSAVSNLEYHGPVFNLEVEGNPSYAAPFIVHNSEGFGIEVLEAMGHGRPVVVSSGAGAADVVEHGKTGIVVPIRDPKAISDAVNDLRQNPSMAEEMGSAARRAAERYTWDKIRAKYVWTWTHGLHVTV